MKGTVSHDLPVGFSWDHSWWGIKNSGRSARRHLSLASEDADLRTTIDGSVLKDTVGTGESRSSTNFPLARRHVGPFRTPPQLEWGHFADCNFHGSHYHSCKKTLCGTAIRQRLAIFFIFFFFLASFTCTQLVEDSALYLKGFQT